MREDERRSPQPVTEAEPAARPKVRNTRIVGDVAIVIALLVAAFLSRRGTLPRDGLWFDDSWVAAGAIHGSPSKILVHGSGTPGFTLILMVVHRLGGGLWALGVPALVAGIVGPALLYVALRTTGFGTAISSVVSATLVVARVHVIYSGRVKGYTFDLLWVLVLVIVIPRLASRRWDWRVACVWTASAFLIGTFSVYTTVAVAVAGLVLLAHPAGDRRVRLGAVGAQAVVQGAYFAAASHTANLSGIEGVLDRTYDAHVRFSANPFVLAHETLTHMGRIAEVFPGGPHGWFEAAAVLAVVGLVWASIKGDGHERLAAQFLLALLVLAWLGSVADRFPFGPSNSVPLSAGGRHTLWLVPSMAFGFAVLLSRAVRAVTRMGVPREATNALAFVAAVAIVLVGYRPALGAPFQGSASATRFVDTSIRTGDVVILDNSSVFAFADSTTTPVRLVDTPKHQIGFAPVYLDHRIHPTGPWTEKGSTIAQSSAWARGATRVLIMAGGGPYGRAGIQQIAAVIASSGFTKCATHAFESNTVVVCGR